MSDKNLEICSRIKEVRIGKNVQQSEVAKAISLTTTAYNRIENGKTQLTVNNLFLIADFLKIEVSELLNMATNKNIHNHENIVMSQFNNGSLHITISAEDIKKLI